VIKSLRNKKILDYWLGGALLILFKPLTRLAGKIFSRDHTLVLRNRVGVLKMLGGGSLTLALPALLGLKKTYPNCRFTLFTTADVKPFADALRLFDDVVLIDDRSFARFAWSLLKSLIAAQGLDTIIDLEVYSRLCGIFCLFTLARNRIGFFLESMFWRRGLYSHLVYFNVFGGSYRYYDQIARLVGALPASPEECRRHVESIISKPEVAPQPYRLAIAPGCSEFGKERMLSIHHWQTVLTRRKTTLTKPEIWFLGTALESSFCDQLIELIRPILPEATFQNKCGALALEESLGRLRVMDEFWGIDSALLHWARLFGIASVSVWGPTDPQTRLRPIPGLKETILYERIPCSPCIHVTEDPPCDGDNICIRRLFETHLTVDLEESAFTRWPKK